MKSIIRAQEKIDIVRTIEGLDLDWDMGLEMYAVSLILREFFFAFLQHEHMPLHKSFYWHASNEPRFRHLFYFFWQKPRLTDLRKRKNVETCNESNNGNK